jgi:hypothetical protein
MAWEELEKLSLVVSEESDEAEPELSEKFLDKLPDELIEKCVWPRLLVLPPMNSAGMCERTLTQEERKEHIRQMCLLRQVCRGWRQWVGEHEDWIYGVYNYYEEFVFPEERPFIFFDEDAEDAIPFDFSEEEDDYSNYYQCRDRELWGEY